MDVKRIILRVSPSLHKRVRVRAAELEISMQDLVVQAVRLYLKLPNDVAPKLKEKTR